MSIQKFNVIIWSFGTSDLYVDWKPIDENFLEKTREIAENIDEYKSRIDFSIFRQFFEQVVEGKYDNIVVKGIFTDQGWYRLDTIYLKDIFSEWLKNKYWNKVRFARTHIILDEANKIDNLTEKLEKAFKSQFDNFNYENVLVNITGGTKWMFGALILASVAYFPLNKLSLYYGERVGNTSETIFSKQEVNKKIIVNQLKSIVETFNYEAIKLFLEKNSYENLFKKIYYAANYGLSRLLCDWEEAVKNYSKAKLPTTLLIPTKEEDINKLEEAINWIIYTRRHNYLAEFMWRVYNFVDKIFINEWLKSIFWKTNIVYDDIIDILDKYDDLKDFLNRCKVDSLQDWWIVYIWHSDRWQSLKWNSEKLSYLKWKDKFISTLVWLALLDYFSNKGLMSRKIFEYGNKLQYLNQYRNQTIIWHWIKPINKKIIQEKLQTNDVEWFFKSILKELSWKDNLWLDKINKFLLEEIKNL